MRIAATIAVLASGCSAIGVGGPPSPIPKGYYGGCSDNYAAPVVDTVFAAGGAALMLTGIIVQAKGNSEEPDPLAGAAAASGVLLMLPYALSAIHGFSSVSSCRSFPRLREQVVAWTKTGAAAARAGDCQAVGRLEREARNIDKDLNAAIFLADPSIKRCLAPARALNPEQSVVARTRAWLLFETATSSARVGDCMAVKAVSAELQRLDAEFHKFLTEVLMQRCLERTTTLPIAPAPVSDSPSPIAPPSSVPVAPIDTAPAPQEQLVPR